MLLRHCAAIHNTKVGELCDVLTVSGKRGIPSQFPHSYMSELLLRVTKQWHFVHGGQTPSTFCSQRLEEKNLGSVHFRQCHVAQNVSTIEEELADAEGKIVSMKT
jgi:hypothetical protein